MEAIEIIERPNGDNNEFDIPDHVTLIVLTEACKTDSDIVLTEACKTDSDHNESSMLKQEKVQESAKVNYIPSLHKQIRNCEVKESNLIREPHKIIVSTRAQQNVSQQVSMPPTSVFKKITDASFLRETAISCSSLTAVQLSSNAQTQTDFLESKINGVENLNIFYCTFHSNGDVETYCNVTDQSARRPHAYDQVNETCGHCNGGNGVDISRLSVSPTPFDDGRKHWIPQATAIERRRQTKVKDLMCEEVADFNTTAEADVLIESTNGQADRAAMLAQKGYELRTQRMRKRFSDMQYTFLQNKKKKRSNFGVAMKCKHCSEEFSTFCRLQKHSKVVHNSVDFSFPCHVCDATFTRPHNLRRHMETKHGGGERRYLCEYCDRRFNRPDILATHLHLIHPKTMVNFKHKKFAVKKRRVNHCSSCNKYFSRIRNFENHTEGDLTCSSCSQVFVCKTMLKQHLYKHHSVACCLCGKTCANRQQLYFHTLSHSPKFSCQYCSKGFLWESQFIVHLATHTGNKPLNCDICGKSFAHKNAVKKHKWQEHTEANKKFSCKFCDKSFVYKAKLESHLRSHTGEKPFSCHLCPSSFSHNCNLAAHVKCVHGIYLQAAKREVHKKVVPALQFNNKTVVKKVPHHGSSESETPPQAFPQVSLSLQNSTQQSVPHHLQLASKQRIEPVTNPPLYSSRAESPTFNSEEAVYQILYAYPNQ